MLCQTLDPVNPFTTAGKPVGFGAASMNFRHALAVSAIRCAARRRTPSGSPSPHTSGGRMALCRSSIRSHTACPTRCALTANAFSPCRLRTSHRPLQYPGSLSAAATSKWSPQHASSMPSYPKDLALAQICSNGKSAHWPVKSVTGRAMADSSFDATWETRRTRRPRRGLGYDHAGRGVSTSGNDGGGHGRKRAITEAGMDGSCGGTKPAGGIHAREIIKSRHGRPARAVNNRAPERPPLTSPRRR